MFGAPFYPHLQMPAAVRRICEDAHRGQFRIRCTIAMACLALLTEQAMAGYGFPDMLATHIHRIRAIAHWKAVTGAAA